MLVRWDTGEQETIQLPAQDPGGEGGAQPGAPEVVAAGPATGCAPRRTPPADPSRRTTAGSRSQQRRNLTAGHQVRPAAAHRSAVQPAGQWPEAPARTTRRTRHGRPAGQRHRRPPQHDGALGAPPGTRGGRARRRRPAGSLSASADDSGAATQGSGGYAATSPGVDGAGPGAGTGSTDPSQPQRLDEQLLAGTTADKVEAAALAKYPGATVVRIETRWDGVYEAHLTTSAGQPVTVEVDKSFTVTGTESMGPGGPGGHGGPGQPTGQPVRRVRDDVDRLRP